MSEVLLYDLTLTHTKELNRIIEKNGFWLKFSHLNISSFFNRIGHCSHWSTTSVGIVPTTANPRVDSREMGGLCFLTRSPQGPQQSLAPHHSSAYQNHLLLRPPVCRGAAFACRSAAEPPCKSRRW